MTTKALQALAKAERKANNEMRKWAYRSFKLRQHSLVIQTRLHEQQELEILIRKAYAGDYLSAESKAKVRDLVAFRQRRKEGEEGELNENQI